MGLDIQRPKGAYAPPATGGVPIGGIIMWSGTVASIPATWQLCDGTNGTPDLRDKFIAGARQDDAGVAKTNLTGSLTQSGGAVSHHHANHSVTQPSDHAAHTHTGPSHQHNLSGGAATAHSHTYTEVPNHVHVQHLPTGQTGSQNSGTRDTSTTGDGTDALSTSNPTGGVATGTTAVNSAGATDNAGTGATGNPSATLTHSGAAVDAHDTLSAPQPYYALAFIQRMS